MATAAAPAKLKVFGAFATPIEEPWDGVIHSALTRAKNAGQIDYTFTDDIGYSGNMERVLRQVAAKNKPNVIFGDAFGNEEAVRRVAKQFPSCSAPVVARPARTFRSSTTGSTSPPT
jgi:basic membrane lipoprotein Med (substrate-binding protein (PBP1-ABC) superfamily)